MSETLRAALARHGEACCAALDEIGVAAAQVTTDGAWVTINRRFSEIVDRPAAEIRAMPLAGVLSIDHAVLAAALPRALSVESQIARPDGRREWIRIAISPVSDPTTDRVGSLLLVAEDVTARKRSEAPEDAARSNGEVGRLIAALEAERSHIARELHDDIAQSLAVLVMQMWRAGKPVSGASGRRHPDVPELCAQVQNIAARVTRLSHELHSASLESRGLEKTIRGACGEFAEGHRTPVSFVCEEIPPELDSCVALCLLRVVQEALQNVAKHSHATRVDVVLFGSPENRLTLDIVDDGVGFDVVEAGLAEGIGLISMRERVRFVGGTFVLSSKRGAGTRIRARVPVRPRLP